MNFPYTEALIENYYNDEDKEEAEIVQYLISSIEKILTYFFEEKKARIYKVKDFLYDYKITPKRASLISRIAKVFQIFVYQTINTSMISVVAKMVDAPKDKRRRSSSPLNVSIVARKKRLLEIKNILNITPLPLVFHEFLNFIDLYGDYNNYVKLNAKIQTQRRKHTVYSLFWEGIENLNYDKLEMSSIIELAINYPKNPKLKKENLISRQYPLAKMLNINLEDANHPKFNLERAYFYAKTLIELLTKRNNDGLTLLDLFELELYRVVLTTLNVKINIEASLIKSPTQNHTDGILLKKIVFSNKSLSKLYAELQGQNKNFRLNNLFYNDTAALHRNVNIPGSIVPNISLKLKIKKLYVRDNEILININQEYWYNIREYEILRQPHKERRFYVVMCELGYGQFCKMKPKEQPKPFFTIPYDISQIKFKNLSVDSKNIFHLKKNIEISGSFVNKHNKTLIELSS